MSARECLVLVASGWLTMTNTLKCGYSLGTKHLSSLTRVGRITLILFLPLGKHSSWVQIELELLYWGHYQENRATAWNTVVVRQGLLCTSMFWLMCLLSCVSESCIPLWYVCSAEEATSHNSLLSFTGQITNQTLFQSFCSEMVLMLSSSMVAAKHAAILIITVWGLQKIPFLNWNESRVCTGYSTDLK